METDVALPIACTKLQPQQGHCASGSILVLEREKRAPSLTGCKENLGLGPCRGDS